MNYSIILASGKGTRIKDNIELPKQFRCISGIPIIVITLREFLKNASFKCHYLVVSKEYEKYTNDLLNQYFSKELNKIKVTIGGKERIDSIENGINAIYENNQIGENDVVVIHDAVRPFITPEIIDNSIKSAREYGAVVCSVPVADTLLISEDANLVNKIPNRNEYYKGQSPDSFKISLFKRLLNNIYKFNKSQYILIIYLFFFVVLQLM